MKALIQKEIRLLGTVMGCSNCAGHRAFPAHPEWFKRAIRHIIYRCAGNGADVHGPNKFWPGIQSAHVLSDTDATGRAQFHLESQNKGSGNRGGDYLARLGLLHVALRARLRHG